MANFTIKKTITLANSVKLEEIFSLDLKNYLENEWYVKSFIIKGQQY